MAMVNMNNLLNGKDSRWLQLEVCREFQRNKCTRPDTECKFAHPPANVEVQNGRVTACYDSIKVSPRFQSLSTCSMINENTVERRTKVSDGTFLFEGQKSATPHATRK
ncbi:protein muscleblind isoform X3 [Nomia melanderi]|uniref:protein muscleblind isoform X3 n=1 Tax=Nomia melanderi TaxID=2448451 RepID=UPI003FCD75A3